MNYNTVLVKYENSYQLRTYQFTIKSDSDNEADCYDVFGENNDSRNNSNFESVENEIDLAFSEVDSKYHFEGHSAYVSVNRSKNKIFYLARSNDWSNGYFVTLEIDQNRYDGRDYNVASELIRKFTDFLRSFDSSIYALFVPELHPSSGRYHFHGLIHGNIKDLLIYSGHKIKGHFIYNFCRGWKYGFTNVTKVDNTLAVEKYICKYTTKELLNSILYQHRYFTLNLKEASIVKLNLYDHDEIYKELIACGLVDFCNTDGLYNRVTYTELKKDDKVLQVLEKYVNNTNRLLNS